MQKIFCCVAFAALVAGLPVAASSGELTVRIADGRATVIARDVPLRQILAEWSRVGDTRMVNAEKLAGGPVTLELIDVPEMEALDILLRSAAGYVAAPRQQPATGASRVDRVIILATSRPPANTPVAPPPFNRPVVPQMPPQPPPEMDDDDGEPLDQGPVPPPGMMQPGVMQPGMHPGVPFPSPPGAEPGEMPVQQAPITAPRPGLLPQPQPAPGNPYSPDPRGAPVQVQPGVLPAPDADQDGPDPQ